jgi:hypothetical protein
LLWSVEQDGRTLPASCVKDGQNIKDELSCLTPEEIIRGRQRRIRIEGSPVWEVLVIAVLVGLLPAVIARGKGYSFGAWWFYGAALFIVALPHALLIKPNQQGLDSQAMAEGKKKCPFCVEMIHADATVCKHCGRDLPSSERQPNVGSRSAPSATGTGTAPLSSATIVWFVVLTAIGVGLVHTVGIVIKARALVSAKSDGFEETSSFTVGSPKQVVIKVQGNPDRSSQYDYVYKNASVKFGAEENVVSWDDPDGMLHTKKPWVRVPPAPSVGGLIPK